MIKVEACNATSVDDDKLEVYFRAAVKAAAIDEGRNLIERVNGCEFEAPSAQQIKRMQRDLSACEARLDRKCARRYGRPVIKRVAIAACIVIILMTLVCGSALCFPQVRSYVGRLLLSESNGFVGINIIISDLSGKPVDEFPNIESVRQYLPKYLPKGMAQASLLVDKNCFKVVYKNASTNKYVILSGYTKNTAASYNNGHSVEIESITLNNSPAYMLKNDDSTGVLWTCNGIVLVVMTDMDSNTAIRIAKSVG